MIVPRWISSAGRFTLTYMAVCFLTNRVFNRYENGVKLRWVALMAIGRRGTFEVFICANCLGVVDWLPSGSAVCSLLRR
jgi:hypothetical protein